MDHEYDTAALPVIGDLVAADPAAGERTPGGGDPSYDRNGRCSSTFDRWCCELPAGHDGQHRVATERQRVEWNDRAAGHRLDGLARPAEHVAREARAAELD
ncbi:hypothetical protein [Curtobacterium sp. VKM Ac-2922]|uniref:hypothetical protein n=1 Tax=Curtobacterium sp. VKM Ac-2922 TaxID=2929475 RepID=UPI001FB23EA0|nr:hypothetical protein [Curtobacterium sp. VKM Ac-2922]MCJ1712854.1 hypothetical protein [Curtobacterium sp. VKM Ac-2922]